MLLRRASALVLAVLGLSTAVLFALGQVTLGALGAAITLAGLVGWWATAARARRPDGVPASPGDPRPATVPPDGHIRFTLVVDGLDPDRLAAVWADLCRPD